MSFTFIGSTPAVCDASTINKRLCFRAICPIDLISTTLPVRFEACVHTMAFVSGRIKASMSDGEIIPLFMPASLHGTISTPTPRSLCIQRGLSTELCSSCVVITCSPGSNSPWIAMFSASVAFAVKTSLAASSPPKNSVRHILASYIFLDASSDASDAPRPELPQCFIASSTASYTASGFLIVVAALSR